MASRFQAASLVASPSYPNSLAWSDENLIAVASDHVVTILNPALPLRPRGLITLPNSEPFPIGVIKREDLLSGCLLPNSLFCDRRPCVRSISWSPLGMAPNSGCLLAVCTIEGRVKLYRPPFCDFCAEWIEVMDISERLYDYLASINFQESGFPSSELSAEQATECEPADDLLISFCRRKRKLRKLDVSSSIVDASVRSNPYTVMEGHGLPKAFPNKEDSSHQIVLVGESKVKSSKKITDNSTLELITADQYASRSAMLSSLVVAWSPMLQLSSNVFPVPPDGSSNSCSLLAVGGKSGKISLWRIQEPQCYSVEHSKVPVVVTLAGLLQAHSSWITTISWAFLASDSLNPLTVMVTGSSDGSVSIWRVSTEELLSSSEVKHSPFVLFKEVIIADGVPVSALAVKVPVQSPHKLLLAVGRGSGSFEVWICDVSDNKFNKAVSHNAHDYIVTGLAWAFDGHCLYSCSQDNFVRSWISHGSSLIEVPIPSNTPGVRSSADVPDVFNSCFGVAVSPGNLVVAVIRSCDADLLHPMYEGRIHKAVVEFFWIGGHHLVDMSSTSPDLCTGTLSGFNQKELVCWESNILWSLKQYEQPDKPMVVWDTIAAILAFKQSAPKYVERILLKWISITFEGTNVGFSTENILPHVSRSFSKIRSRQLQLLNIICRRVILSEMMANELNDKLYKLGGLSRAGEEQLTSWMELLLLSEKELRKRLVGIIFSVCTSLDSSQPGYWCPDGLAQMKQWVALNDDHVYDKLNSLASELETCAKRYKYGVKEQCSYCSEPVPFESADYAFCGSTKCTNGVGQKHKLARCAISMQVCPISPVWFCMCCHRWACKLAPETLFTMPRYPLDFPFRVEFSKSEVFSKPLCPFCGIVLQRLQPEFLLSASPV